MTVPSWDPTKPAFDTLLASAEVRSNLNALAWDGAINLAANGDMLFWSAGDTAAPDYFTLSGAGASILRTGVGGSDVRPGYVGQWCARVTAGGSATASLAQSILGATSFARASQMFRLAPVVSGAFVYCGSLNGARMAINDGVGITYGPYHTGTGWELITVPRTLNSAATVLQPFVSVTAGVTAYIDGFMVMFGPVLPQRYVPSLIQRGTLTLVQQGTLGVGTTISGVRFYAQRPMMVTETRAALGGVSAGASVIFDVNKNGSSMYTTKVSIAAGVQTGSGIPDGTYASRCVARGQYITVDIDQVGSPGFEGSDATVLVDALVYTRPLEALLLPSEV